MGDGWRTVERRRSRIGKASALRNADTFFFRNFPEDSTKEELRRRFEEVGRVVDLFIPAKRDKVGKRFGFVFWKGGEEERLLEKLNKVWIGSFVIRAFRPRFERLREMGVSKGRKTEEVRGITEDSSVFRAGDRRAERVSFSEALRGVDGKTWKVKGVEGARGL